jgi:hypothetical protein
MNSYSASKAHNMLVLMLDLRFKDLNLVGDYVDHTPTIEIACAYDVHFLFPTHQELYQKMHGQSVTSSVHQEIVHNSNVVFGVGASEMETSLEQVSFLFPCVYVTRDFMFFRILHVECRPLTFFHTLHMNSGLLKV